MLAYIDVLPNRRLPEISDPKRKIKGYSNSTRTRLETMWISRVTDPKSSSIESSITRFLPASILASYSTRNLEPTNTINANYPNIQYICESCRIDKNMKKDVIVSNRLCVMEDMKDMKQTMDTKLQSVEDMLKKLTVPGENEPRVNTPSYADKAKTEPSVIVIKKKKNGPPADMDKIHKAVVDTNSAVSKAYTNTAGDTVVVCEDKDSRESLLPVLTESMDQERYKLVTPKSRLPTVTITDIASDYTKEDLLSRVKSQNASKFTGLDLSADSFKMIYTKPQKRNINLFRAVVRVSEEVRKAIHCAGNKLNIGLTSCRVFDDFFVRRCNKCQGFNHWKNDCPAEAPTVCGKCSGEHDTNTCTSDTVKCHNCAKANYPDTAHETFYYKCRAYVDAQKKLESTINYYKNNQKN